MDRTIDVGFDIWHNTDIWSEEFDEQSGWFWRIDWEYIAATNWHGPFATEQAMHDDIRAWGNHVR